MGDGSLSQDEIDALLQGADDILTTPSATPSMDFAGRGGAISPAERDSLSDLLNTTMEMVVPSLSGYLGKNITITNAYVEIKSQADIRKDFGKKYIQLPVNFTGGFTGNNLVVFNYEDAEIISSLMMGDDSGTPPEEMTDAHQSTIQEFVSQMLSSMATGFSNKLGRSIGITPPNLSVVNRVKDLQVPPGDEIAKVTYNLKIENLINSKFYQLIEVSLGSDIAKSLMAESGGGGMQSMPQQSMGQMEQQMGPQVGISSV
jgi:flagellar motor switch protein FliN/FliY